jgi:spore maturation protein A
MLNYIWAGLIASSLLFAIGYDAKDLARNTYRNGEGLPVRMTLPSGDDGQARRVDVRIQIDPETYAAFYDTEARPAASYDGYVIRSEDGVQLRFAADSELPEPLSTIQGSSRSQDGELQGVLAGDLLRAGAPSRPAGATLETTVRFERVRFVKLNAIADAALSSAETAATIALGLIGVLALFLGLLQIAEQAGIIRAVVRIVRPVLKPLFPEIPEDHPALGMIALNFAANIFGLGNAATPFGIKAMEELQTLNPTDDTATNPMVMFLAINTASVQIVPPVLLLALLGLQINQLVFAIIITTGLSLVIAVAAVKLYGRIPSVRASDPNRVPPAPAAGERS